tara:strand:+ start:3439 stop:3807 length:369 start_codon:yes stop_codon:yes gene_type:complete
MGTNTDISKSFKGSRKTQLSKQAFLELLTAHVGLVTQALKEASIGSSTHYRWLDVDAAYKEAVASIVNAKKDVIETALFNLIKKGNAQAVIFAARTLLKDKGYSESLDITSNNEPITLNINI